MQIDDPRLTAAQLTALNPLVPLGVLVVESDTGKAKMSVGVPMRWTALPYWSPGGASEGGGGEGGGSMDDFTVDADTGTPQTIADGNTLTIAGGTGIDTTVGSTDAVTVSLDSATSEKIAGIEVGADVTDATNVKAALDGMSLSDVGAPESTDRILLQDASASNALKYADFSEFGGGGGGDPDWGDIGGTLATQTDLQAALDAKVFTSDTGDGPEVLTIACYTETGYAGLGSKDPNTLYIVVEDE